MLVGQLDIVKLLGQLWKRRILILWKRVCLMIWQSNVPAKTINADGNLLARLFDNLIGNAIKYGQMESGSWCRSMQKAKQ